MGKTKELLNSINARLIMLVVICIIALSAVFVAITSKVLGDTLGKNAAAEMNLFCSERGTDINTELLRAEDAVGAMSRWTSSRFTTLDTLKGNQTIRDSIINDLKDEIPIIVSDNMFVQSAYVHYTLDVTGPVDRTEGIYYSRNKNGELYSINYTQVEIRDDPVSKYYYIAPISARKAIWSRPYYDSSVNDYLISYVNPLFIGDTPVAIAGIDISFTKLLDWVDDIKFHNSGYMYLKESDGTTHYHVDYDKKIDMHGDEVDEIIGDNEIMSYRETNPNLIHYHYGGDNRVMVFVTIRNGMKFVLCDSYTEIYEQRDNMIRTMIITGIALAIIFSIVAALMASHMTRALRKLTYVASQIAKGNYNVTLPPETDDEIGHLTRSIKYAISHIREHNDELRAHMTEQRKELENERQALIKSDKDLMKMKNIAYIDSLTNVKNKTAYDDTVASLNAKIKSGIAEFAVVVCDLNYLKLINDELGHQAGDKAIKRTAVILCQIFTLSTIFRIGGDEFAVIPMDVEYHKIEDLIKQLDDLMEEERKKSDIITKRISIAYGYSIYDKETDNSFKDVFEKADMAMYESKRATHKLDGYEVR